MASLTEIERGRFEAVHTVLTAIDVESYLSPEPDTPFPLRYAFYLLGDVRGKTVLDFGCGSGRNVAPLLARGANVVAVDLSQELIELAQQRLAITKRDGECRFVVASAYEVPLPDGAFDVILCSSLLHHLTIPRAMAEMKRLLKPDGVAIVKEPVRFSKTLAAARSLFPAKENVSKDEHPLTKPEFAQVKEGWISTGERSFRLPLVPVMEKLLAKENKLKVWPVDGWILKKFGVLDHFATIRVLKLVKTG
jgi:ubiquinone/menaquinone biosynthesis C-methylase UbiE